MSESDLPIIGRVDLIPDTGFKMNLIQKEDIRKGDTIVLLKKENNQFSFLSGVSIVKELTSDGIIIAFDYNELGDEKVRKALAKSLVEMNKDEIMRQSLEVAEDALSRKPVSQLKSFFRQKQKGNKLKMRSQRGCVSFGFGENEVIL